MVIDILHTGLAFDAVGHIFVDFSLTSIAEFVAISNEFHVRLSLDSWVQQNSEDVCRIDHEQDEDIHILCDVVELFITTAPSADPLQDNDEQEQGVDEEDAGQRGQWAISEDEKGGCAFVGVAERTVPLEGVVEVLLGRSLGQALAHSIINLSLQDLFVCNICDCRQRMLIQCGYSLIRWLVMVKFFRQFCIQMKSFFIRIKLMPMAKATCYPSACMPVISELLLRIILTTMSRNDPNFIQYHLIQFLLDSAVRTALTNAFIKKNTPSFILQRQQQTITNLTRQTIFIPPYEPIVQDVQSLPLKEDSLMAVSQLDQAPAVLAVTNKSIGKQSGKSSKGQFKTRMATEKPEVSVAPYKSLTRELPQQKRKDSEGNPPDSDYILHLRTFKEAERERLQHPNEQTQRQKPRPPKGQKLVFDYQGKFGKGKELPSGQFQQRIMESSVQMGKQAKKGEKSDRQTQQTTIINRILDKSVRNRSDFRKDFDQTPQQKRELMLNSLKLSNSRTKLVFDGHQVTQTESDNRLVGPAAVAISAIRKKSSAKAGLFLANEQDGPFNETQKINQSLKQKQKLSGQSQRSRMKTVASEGKKQRINFQNEALKQVLMTQIEDSHFQLPKNRNLRANTQISNSPAASVHTEDADLARIREKLNFRSNNEKLPRILSKYSHIEKDILKQLRRKSKLP